MQALHPTNFRRRIASLMLVAYCASPILATAQVVINAGTPNDGRRAYVDQTQNGLPKVNIAAPNGAGVSRNTYSDFNVGKQGVILNNATNNSNTSLAGWVEGNPNLVPGKEAKLIFNEVIGTKQSQLNGFIEVAGKKADVIVANENGITCNGCGFINTTRGTLSTGTAIWGSAGQLDGLKVRQGTITIGADGMSTPESRIDLLSQAINIQGAIHADQLNIVAGNNDIAYDTLKVNAATSSNLGSFDVSQLGGMYANQINLVATGAGIGVRIDGTLVSAGNVSINTDGLLTHSGKTSAQGNIQANAKNLTQSGSIVAVGKLDVTGDTLSNAGSLVGQDVTVSMTGAISNQTTSTIGANANLAVTSNTLQNSGKINAKKTGTIVTGALTNTGEIVTDEKLVINASSLNNSGKVYANGVTTTVTDALTNTSAATLTAANTLTIKANAINNAGSLAADQTVDLEAASLIQSGSLVSKGKLTARKLSSVENTGTLTANQLNLQTDRLVNLGTGLIAASGDAAVTATTLNNLGRIHVDGETTLTTHRLNNAGKLEAIGGLTASQVLSVQNSGSLTGGDVVLNTQTLDNTGRIEVQSLNATAYTSTQATEVKNSGVIAADRVTLKGFDQVSNSNQISTDVTWASARADSGKVEISTGTFDNTNGRVLARGNLDITATNVRNAKSTLSSKGDMRITATQDIDNQEGLILHQGSGSALVQATRTLSNTKGQIEGQGQSLTVKGGDIDNTEGQILQASTRDPLVSPSQLTIAATADSVSTGLLRNVKGNISGTGNVELTANALVTDASSAQLSSVGTLKFFDKSKATTGATTATSTYDWEADIAASAAVTNAKTAADQAAATATQTATALTTAQATLTRLQADKTSTAAAIAKAQSDVNAANTANQSAQAASATAQQALADAQAAVPAIDFGTAGANPTQPGNNPAELTVPTPPQIVLPVASSQVQAGHNLSVITGAGLLDNRQGKLAATNNLTVTAAGNVLAGQMQAGKDLTVTAKQLEIDQQVLSKNTKLTADTLIVTGRVQGDDTLTIQADSLTNSGTITGNATSLAGKTNATSLELGNTGMVQGNNSLDIKANRLLNQATLASGGDLTTTTATSLENQALIFSVGHQKHYGVDIVNHQGRFYALGDITMQGNPAGDNATSILNYIGRIEAQGDIDLRANTVTNRAVVPTSNARGIVEKISTSTQIRTVAKDTFNADGKASEILAGKNLNIEADELNNDYGIISARLNATIGTRLLKNRSLGAIQTENMVVKAACFNCHQTVSHSETWGGVIAAGATAIVTAPIIDNQTIDTRDGFAGLSTDPRVVRVDERSGAQSPLTRAFVDRFGVVNGPSASAAGSAPSLKLGSPKTLSDGIVLTPSGKFDFSQYVLPNGKTGLFVVADPASPYLIKGRSDLYTPATNGQYTVYNKFAGSDYLLTRLGLMPVGLKRLGDAWYETQLVQDQLYALTGRTHLAVGTDSDYDMMMGLMDAGLLAQAKFGLSAGDSLSAEQQAALTQPIVWPEWQVVDGQRVLVPKVYLAKADIDNNDNNKGARIVGTDVAITTRELNNSGTLAATNSLVINASGKVSGGGSYSGGKAVAIVADSVDLKSASIQSGGWLNIDTANDMTLASTQIKAAGDATLTAGGALTLKAQEFNTKVVRGDGTSRTETKYETSNIDAGGTVVLSAKKDVTLEGSKVDAGNNLLVESKQGNVNLVALKEVSDYSYNGDGALVQIQAKEKAAQANAAQDTTPQEQTFAAEIVNHTQVHEESLQNVRLSSKGNATVQANQGDIKATALDINAGQNINLQAGGVVQLDAMQTNNSTVQDKQVLTGVSVDAETNTQTANYQNQTTRQSSTQANGGTLKAGNDVTINGGQVSLSHTNAVAARDIKVEATDGGAALKAVDMQAERNFELGSAGNTAIVSDATEAANGSISQATSRIKAGNQANVTALNNLTVQGGDVQAKDINLIAMGDVTLTGVQNKQVYGGGNDTTTVTTTQSLNLKGDNVNIQGVGQTSNVALVAANVDATNKATIAGNGDVTIASAENRTTHEWTTTNKDCNWWGKCTTTVTHGLEDKTTQVGSDIKGGTVEISAGKNLTTVASTIESPGNVSLSAQGTIDYQAALNVDKKEVQSNSSSSWMGIDMKWLTAKPTDKETKDSSIQTRAATTSLQSEADILSESGGSTRLQGTQVKAGTFTVNAGVGPKANPNAKIIIEGVKETLQTSHTEKSKSLVWQSMSGNGVTEETLKLAQINTKTKFSAPGGIDVQLPAGDPLKTQVQTLSKQPGMQWLNELSQRKDVNWQEIKLAKDSWSYDQQGLTHAGAIIVAVAVMAATSGAGAGLAGTATTATSAAGVTTTTTTLAGTTLATSTAGAAASYTAAGAALNAGFSALAVQASISLANNDGDISKTLKDMGSSTSVRNTLVAMATAGVGTSVAGQGVSAVAAQTAAGCASGAVTGAGCEKGATTAAVLSTAGETYQSLVGYAANAGPGENRNGFGKTDQTYSPDSFGRQSPADQGMNVIGLNAPGSLLSQGGGVSRALNQVPFINATAGLHDYFFNSNQDLNFSLWNVPTMLPAAALAIPAALNNPNISWLTQVKQPDGITSAPPWSTTTLPSVQSIIRINSGTDFQKAANIEGLK